MTAVSRKQKKLAIKKQNAIHKVQEAIAGRTIEGQTVHTRESGEGGRDWKHTQELSLPRVVVKVALLWNLLFMCCI